MTKLGLLAAGVFVALFLTITGALAATADATQFFRGREAIHRMAGCYLVDYSYTEVESLKAGYERDRRVYDVNKDKAVKEWIYVEDLSALRTRVQHILFATDLAGKFMVGSELRHQAEDWEYDAAFLYDFAAPQNWQVQDLSATPGLWTRRVTNLDDGLRYQCAASWNLTNRFPEWTCANYAPIPGRETRDMGRRDYNTLRRSTRLVVYDGSWLERQDNVKTVHAADGVRTPLARELGKNWYVRLPDAECAPVMPFVDGGRAFWEVLRETWDQILVGDRTYREMIPAGAPPRFNAILGLQEKYETRNLADTAVREAAKAEISKVIADYRKD